MAKEIHRITFPKGNIIQYKTKNGTVSCRIEYNKSYENKFNTNLNKIQYFLDDTVAKNLASYVSFKSGQQSKSIKLATEYGSGVVTIGVPYAWYQAYSPRIRKRVGRRGTYPFERMVADKGESILRQVAAYSRRLNG